ncbi:MAG: sensor histidine kinase [Anaerolineae bacterium]
MYFLYFVSPLLSTLITAVAALYAWRHRRTHSAASFAWLMTFATLWSGGYALQVVSPNLNIAQFIDKVYFSAIILLPIAWFVFACSYTDNRAWISRRTLLLLLLVPSVSLALNWTNPFHHLFFKSLTFRREGVLLIPHRINGPWFYIHAFYNYVLIVVGMYLLLRQAIRTFQIYRLQALALLVGSIAPLIPNILVTFQWVEMPLTHVGFTITGLIYGWALFRYQLLDLVPVAREKIIDNMDDGMLLLDAQGRILDFNPTMQKILGLPPHKALGQPVDKLIQDQPQLLHQIEATGDQKTELRIQLPEEERYYDLQISTLKNHLGQVNARLLILHDITQRIIAEAALQRYATELEVSNAELDAFAHTVAHDLKNPLSALVGYAQLLESRHAKLPEETLVSNLQIIGRNARKMANIIEELLLLASVRKVDDVKTRTLKMGPVVDNALRRLEDMIHDHHAHISVQKQWPLCIGYGPWIEEVWVNYLSNAIKYGGTPPQIEVGVTPLTREGQKWVHFWVRDNGEGLTPEEREKLFTQFERLNQTRAEGHGLGLSIVQRIMEKLGGQVGVESEERKGSCFWFSLPAAEEVTFNKNAPVGR